MNIDGDILERLFEKRGTQLGWCSHYGEPGYTDPKKLILFANWNNIKRSTQDWLEHHGYELEWEDEWEIDHEGQRAYRSSPDSYLWSPSFVYTEGGDIIGRPDIEAGDCVDEYIELLLNSDRRCDTFGVDWAKHGFVKLNTESYENGWHQGQTDNPKVILLAAKAMYPGCDFIFQLDSQGQFDSAFSIWRREKDQSDEQAA